MSSIDKYVLNKVKEFDSSAYMLKSGGMINCYIDGELVAQVADRYGYLSDSESLSIQMQMQRYQMRVIQRRFLEQQRKEEERRREQLRKDKYRQLESDFDSKASIFAVNKENIEKQFKKQKSEFDTFRSDINEVIKILPNTNARLLSKKIEEAKESFDVKAQVQINKIEKTVNDLKLLKKTLKSNMTLEAIDDANNKLNNININIDAIDITIEKEEISKSIIDAKEIANKVKDILSNLDIIKDDYIKREVLTDLGEIDVFDKETVKAVMSNVQGRIDKYRNNIQQKNLRNEVKELTKLESLAIGIKNFVQFNANDTYTISENRMKIINKATTLIEELTELASIKANLVNFDVASVINELYNISSNPKDISSTYDFLKLCENEITLGKERFKDYKVQYDNFNILVEELVEQGKSYDGIFNYNDYINQRNELQEKLVSAIHENELSQLTENTFLNIASMSKAGYQLFKKESSDYYTENYFINKELPGTVTRVLIMANGETRISLLPTKIDDKVCNTEEMLRIARTAEEKILAYFKDCHDNGTAGDIDFNRTVSFDSPNAIEELNKNGYFELNEEGKEIYFKMFSELKECMDNPEAIHRFTPQQQQVYSNLFEKFNTNKHHASDTSQDKVNARNNSKSQVMYMRFHN